MKNKHVQIRVFYSFSRTARQQAWLQQNQPTGRLDVQTVHTHTMESLLEPLKALRAKEKSLQGPEKWIDCSIL